MIRLSIGLVAALLLAGPARAAAQPRAADVDAVLKLPITPAAVALLGNHVTDSRVQERLAAALGDARPEVRLVAARVIFIAHITSLSPAVLDALDREQDPRAGIEEVRAAVDLGGAAAETRIFAAAQRLGDPAPRVFLIGLSRTRPAAVIDRVAALVPRFRQAASAGTVLAAAVLRDQTLTAAALDLLAASPDNAQHDLIPSFFTALDFVDPDSVAIVTRARQSSSERVRCAPIWQAATSLARGEQVHNGILSLIAAAPAATPGSMDAFARDLLARVWKRSAPSTSWPPLLRDKNWRVPELMQAWMTKEEFAALKPPGFRADPATQPSKNQPVATPYVAPDTLRLRSLSTLPAALLDEVMTLTGCTTPASLDKAGAEIHYTDSGRPTRIALTADHPAAACDLAMRTVAALMIARDDELRPARAVDLVALGINRSLAACARTAPIVPVALPITGDKSLPRPQVKHEQKPDFPSGARARGVQGTPWVRAVVTTQGCVSEMDVVRRTDPELDLAALAAVSRWRFDPVPLDPAIALDVVIEVSFKIGR